MYRTKTVVQHGSICIIFRGSIEIEADDTGFITVAHWPYEGDRKALANIYGKPVTIEVSTMEY